MKMILLLVFFILVQISFSQTVLNGILKVTEKKGVYSYDMADSLKIDYVRLSDEYKSLWDDNLEFIQVFKSNDEKIEKISNAWNKLLQDIGKFIRNNGYHWEESSNFSIKFYFDENGNIDYLFYKLKLKGFKHEQDFINILTIFINFYKFPIKAKGKYSQCGSIILK